MPDAPSPVDRRVQRTRRMLLDALFELMVERGYERLTIQNVLDRAGVGRATFYMHFAGKAELLARSVEGLRGSLAQAAKKAPEQRFGFTLPFFQHLAGHRRLYDIVVARDSEVTVERYVRTMLQTLVRDELTNRPGPACSEPGVPVDLLVPYVVGSLWSTAAWWVASGFAIDPEEVDALFRRLTLQGVADLS